MTVRVIQWATGAVGVASLREVIDRPDLELVGLFVYSDDKVGVDAGTIAGRDTTGVLATNDKDEILALEADLVLHNASKAFPVNTNADDLVALLESGKSVITTTSYTHLPTYDPALDERIRAACTRTGSRFHAAGEHPGFMFERLATSITALCQRIDTITVQEYVDVSRVPAKGMLTDLMGMGKMPDEITVDAPMFRSLSLQYEQAIGAAADVLGMTIDEIRPSIRVGTSPNDVKVAFGVLPAGTVVGQILTWTGYHDGTPRLVAEEYWTVTDDIPDWDLSLDGFHIRVLIDGAPPFRLDLTIDRDRIGPEGAVVTGQAMVAMTAVNAVHDVLTAPAGVVIPPVFGAFRSTLLG